MRVLLPLLLLSCDAEDVGVRVPQGGVDAVQASDLRRTMWTLTDPRLGGRSPGSSGARRVAAEVGKRFHQAHLQPGFGDSFARDLGGGRGEMVCGIHQGGGGGAEVVVALDPGVGTLSAVPIAGLVALSLAFDGPEKLEKPFILCLLPESGGLNGYVEAPPHPLSQTAHFTILGSLTGDTLQGASGPEIAGIRSKVLHTGPLAPDLGDDIGRLDFDGIATQVRAAYLQLSEAQ